MKSYYYIIFFAVFSCTKPSLVKNNDLEKENLKGNVKSTYTEERFIKKKNGKYFFHGKIINKQIECFNPYGLYTYECNSETGFKDEYRSEYHFDNLNRVEKQVDYGSVLGTIKRNFYYSNNCVSIFIKLEDNLLLRKTIDLYNQNRLVRTNQFLQNQKTKKFYLHSYYTYLYNKHKQDSIVSYYVYSKKKNKYILSQQENFQYDIKTHELLKHVNYHLWYHYDDPANIEYKKRGIYTFKDYQYKYDKKGNWIEKIVQVNGILKGYRRKINYFV